MKKSMYPEPRIKLQSPKNRHTSNETWVRRTTSPPTKGVQPHIRRST